MSILDRENDKLLYAFLKANEEEYRMTISSASIPNSFEDFRLDLEKDFETGKEIQFVVFKEGVLVGTIYVYNIHDKWNLSGFYSKEVRKTRIPFLTIVVTLEYIRDNLYGSEIFFSTYQENVEMNSIAQRTGVFENVRIGMSSKRVVNEYRVSLDSLAHVSKLKSIMLARFSD